MFFSSSTTRMFAMRGRVLERAALCVRQLDREAAAAPALALEVDPAAVRLHHIAHDREAEAGCAAVLALCEALEDPLALLGRDPGAAVLDGESHAFTRGRERDPDRS